MRKLLLFATAAAGSPEAAVEGPQKLVARYQASMRVRQLAIKLDQLIASDER